MDYLKCGVVSNLIKMQGFVRRIGARPNIDDDFSWEKLPTPMLDAIDNPLCLKNLSIKV